MITPLNLTIGHRPDGTPCLSAAGEIDMSNAHTFASALTAATSEADGRPLVVDLTQIEYLDSAGLTALFSHIEHIQILASPLLAPVLTISGLAGLTTIHDP